MSKEFEEFQKEFSENKLNKSNDTVSRKKHKCPKCSDFIDDAYLEQNPYPEIPCSSCGALIEISSIQDIEVPEANQRSEKRCNVSLKVAYKSFDKFITEYTKNVSNGGMFLRTMQHHEIGTHVNLYLHMPDLKKPLKITGEVIHTRFFDAKDEDTGVGIKFINIDETSRQSLIDFMKNQEDCY
jgi:uncharacterized protein (TIGR02266 family)